MNYYHYHFAVLYMMLNIVTLNAILQKEQTLTTPSMNTMMNRIIEAKSIFIYGFEYHPELPYQGFPVYERLKLV